MTGSVRASENGRFCQEIAPEIFAGNRNRGKLRHREARRRLCELFKKVRVNAVVLLAFLSWSGVCTSKDLRVSFVPIGFFFLVVVSLML